jgi:hypothetical protein
VWTSWRPPLQLPPMTVSEFIPPCCPVPAKAAPVGHGWQHEVKFDGYRVQIHKIGKDLAIYSRNGHLFTSRFEAISYMLRELPARSVNLGATAYACVPPACTSMSAARPAKATAAAIVTSADASSRQDQRARHRVRSHGAPSCSGADGPGRRHSVYLASHSSALPHDKGRDKARERWGYGQASIEARLRQPVFFRNRLG